MQRIEFFSDAVFAIAITLLSLDLRLPPGTNRADISHQLTTMWPAYGAFTFTFVLIGLRWLTHHVQFRYIRFHDYPLLGLNLALLLVVAFLPFPTRVLSEFPGSRSASVLYAATMAVAGLLSISLWVYACHADLVDKETLGEPFKSNLATIERDLFRRWVPLPLLFGLAIALALGVSNLWAARGVALATPGVQLWIAARQSRRLGYWF